MTKTINLTGAEVAVTGLDGAHAHISNMGADIIYASKTAGITAGADGVVPIPAGNGNTLRGISGTVYLLGTGSVLIQSDDYVQHPSFRNSTASGGSAVDEQARTAINEHSGNAEIHVTADEKTAWDAKADLSDIPDSLPANGGNASTLDGKHSAEFTQSYFVPSVADVNQQLENGYYMMAENSANAPETGFGFLFVAKAGNVDISINWIAQFWYSINTGAIYKRMITNGTFGNWDNILGN